MAVFCDRRMALAAYNETFYHADGSTYRFIKPCDAVVSGCASERLLRLEHRVNYQLLHVHVLETIEVSGAVLAGRYSGQT